MADSNQVKTLTASIDKALEFFKKDLVRRSEWGSITFEKAEPATLNKGLPRPGGADLHHHAMTLHLDAMPVETARRFKSGG